MVQMIHLMTAMLTLTGTASAWTFSTCEAANPGLAQCSQTTGEGNSVSHLGRPGRAGGPRKRPSTGNGASGFAKGAAKSFAEGALNEAGQQLYDELFPEAAAGGQSPSSTRFAYDSGDGSDQGYWHSHDQDGLYVSPKGYFYPNAGYNILIVNSKDGSATAWTSYLPCCLPDNVGTGIDNLMAYQS